VGAQYSVNWEGPVSSAAATISAGYCVCPTSSGFVVATSANRTTYGRPSGIAMTAGDAANPIQIVHVGPLTASQTGLGAGTASPIRVSSTGTLERVATPSSSDDVVGYCFTDGSAHVSFGVLSHRVYVDSGGGGGSVAVGDITGMGTGVATFLATPSPANFGSALTGAVNVADGGTGLTALGTGLQYLRTNAGAAAMEWASLPTFPSGTIVGNSDSQTLTNKTISFTSNTVTFSSAEARTACSDETGTGAMVFADTPSLITPKIADSAGGQFYNIAVSNLAADRTITLPLLGASDVFVFEAFAQTLTNKTINGANNTLTVRIANDVSGLGTGVATFLGTPSGANLASALTTALPDSKGGTGLTALGSGVATMLGTFSSANIRSACTDETGSGGGLVFATSPTLTTPVINGQTQGAAVAIAALAIDWSLGTVFTKTLSAGGNTFTFSNQASGMVITVRLTSNGGGSTVTWPTVKWAGGAAPTQTSTGTDVYTFVHDGTSVYGSVVQAMA